MVTIELSEETAAALEAQAALAGLELPAYLAMIASRPIEDSASADVDRLKHWNDLMNSVRPGHPSPDKDERLKHWQAAIDAIPPADHFVDDSRESIYPDRS